MKRIFVAILFIIAGGTALAQFEERKHSGECEDGRTWSSTMIVNTFTGRVEIVYGLNCQGETYVKQVEIAEREADPPEQEKRLPLPPESKPTIGGKVPERIEEFIANH